MTFACILPILGAGNWVLGGSDTIPQVGRAAILNRLIIWFAAAFVVPAAGTAEQSALENAQGVLTRAAEPLFEAAEIAPEMRFRFELVDSDEYTASFVGKGVARVSVPLFLLAGRPEELAALAARLLAMKEIPDPRRVFFSGYRVQTRPPTESAYSGKATSIHDNVIRRSEAAAEETLRSESAPPGVSPEELRATAQRRDAYAVEMMRRAGLSSASLLGLYEEMARAGAGIFERPDFEGRRILAEQLAWLRKHTDPEPARAQRWTALDARLAAARRALEEG